MYRIRDADDDNPDTQYVADADFANKASNIWGDKHLAKTFTEDQVVAFIADPSSRFNLPGTMVVYNFVAEPVDE